MFLMLDVGKKLDDQRRALRLEHLYNEIHSLLDNVTNNTYTLLKRTQRLKVNRQQLTYAARVKEARLLIDQYIVPLNRIVDLNDANSIATLLQNIAKKINLDRMAAYSPSVIERYELVDGLLRQVNGKLQREADVIRRELTPLIERIQRESEVLGGWLLFLERPLLSAVPDVAKRHVLQVFGDQTEADLKMYIEQFIRAKRAASIKLNTAPDGKLDIPLLDRADYRKRLREAVPLSDFFSWCMTQIQKLPPERQERDLLELTSLLFNEEDYELVFGEDRLHFTFNRQRYLLPTLSVRLNTATTS
jgi:hypothetical protein